MRRIRIDLSFKSRFVGWADVLALSVLVAFCGGIVGIDLLIDRYFVSGCEGCGEPGVFSQGLGTLVIYGTVLGIAAFFVYVLMLYFFSFRQAQFDTPAMSVFLAASVLVGLPLTLYAYFAESDRGPLLACTLWFLISGSKLLVWKRDHYDAAVMGFLTLTALTAAWPLVIRSLAG